MPDLPVSMTWAAHVDERNAPLEAALDLAKRRAEAPESCTVDMPRSRIMLSPAIDMLVRRT